MGDNNTLVDIKSKGDLQNQFATDGGAGGGGTRKAVLLFGADWHEACPALRVVLNALAEGTSSGLLFGNIDAEGASDLSDTYNVTVVPTVVLLNGGPENVMERLEGVVEPSLVTSAVQRLIHAPDGVALATGPIKTRAGLSSSSSSPAVQVNPQDALKERLDRLVRTDTVMLFMKGTPDAPRCGFSRQAVETLKENEVPFGSFDILADEDVRQGLKTYSDWPTYPQLYVKGELIGGLDILKETAAEGPLKEQWEIDESTPRQDTLHDRLSKLVKRHNVMLFMKGLPSAPRCGFSRQIVDILDESEIPYDAFNILQDDDVRQGLKEFSNWPTFPQLYVNGELVGGLDIVQELKETGELEDVLRG